MIKILKNTFSSLWGSEDHNNELHSFHNYYLETSGFVRSVIRQLINNESIVDELVQETYVRAWKSYKKFNHDSTFKTWIYRIATNITYDYFNKQKKLKIEKDDFNKNQNSDSEKIDIINKGLLKLSLEQLEVFILFYKYDYTISEISKELKTAEGTVKSRLYYSREIFVKYLKENGIEHE